MHYNRTIRFIIENIHYTVLGMLIVRLYTLRTRKRILVGDGFVC